ncbi:hypothetical protein UFOVP68_13 [uncultured Caudovirales phage]|uniref:Uncharacterized protein n=1 Tax=uncultured Caudovirales phage TaxID=2100421 RepID=A0A6J5KVU4_9CAUD|nr:hypothetical protein UFOVP68_13 [uncultured Caudovirales phage]
MIDLVPARAEMALLIRPQPIQIKLGALITPQTLQARIDTGLAFAVIDGNEILALGGAQDLWPGRAVAWGLLCSGIGATMVPITRAVRRFLDTSPIRRIEAEVAVDHEEGRRWAEMLGFKREGTMRAYFNGADFHLYARVRD